MKFEDTFSKIEQFVIEQRGTYLKSFNRNTTLEKDLGITGDDAIEFMEEFVNQFQLDSRDFEISKYFSEEGFDLLGLGFLIRKFFNQPIPKYSNHDLTLGDLQDWIERGYWVDP